MTLTTTTNRNDYTGTGAINTYPYTFKIFNETDLEVYRIDTLNNETLLTLSTDYTVTGVGNYSGGNVVLTTDLTLDYKLAIVRVVPITQETHFRNQGPFYPERHEDALDLLTMISQQLQEQIERSMIAPIGGNVDLQLPTPIAGNALVWNATGTALINAAAASASLAVNLADTASIGNGDALMGVLAPFTGAIPRTQHDINAEFLSVKSFGAVGNGVADDYAAIQAALDAYGIIYMPPGAYLISEGIVLTRSVRILAAGQSSEAAIIRDFSGVDETDGMLVLPPISAGSYIDGVNFYTLSGQSGGSIIYGYATVSATNGLTTFNNCRFSTTGTNTHDYTILIDGTEKNTGALGFRFICFANCSIFGAHVATIEFRGVIHFNVSGGQVPAAGGTGSIVNFTGVSGVESSNGIFNPGDTNCDIYFDYARYIICDCSTMGQVYNTANAQYIIVRGHSAYPCENNWLSSRFDPTNPCGAHAFPGGNLENVTGDGTEYFPVLNGQLFDHDISYNTTTGRLTAKQPGILLVNFCYMCSGLLSTHTKYDLFLYRYSSADVLLQTYRKTGNAYNLANSDTQASIGFETTVQMNSDDYLVPSIIIYNGTRVVDILATSVRQTFFQATKIR